MNAYFFKMNREEKDNILDQHKQVYDGYVTRYNQESNQTPLYVQDLANDKNGITVSNKGVVKNYTNMNINEAMLDKIGDGPNDLENGTVDLDQVSNSDHEMMHDTYPSPNEDENDEYVSFGEYAKEMNQNLDQYEYDIDELDDYSTDELFEMFSDDPEPDFVDSEEYPEFEGGGEEEEISGEIPKFDWLRTHQDLEEDDTEQLVSNITESLDMFKRFKKYN
jgi:hypothetical protein